LQSHLVMSIHGTHRRAAGLAMVCFALLGSIRQDEFECEEAAVHLDDCCAEVDGTALDCRFVEGGCERDSKPTQLSVSQSQCILRRDCASLRESGICEAVAEALAPPAPSTVGGRPTQPELEACP
jgi:hypothetical protein